MNLILGALGPPTLADLIPVALLRLPRRPCEGCERRRVLFVLTVYGEPRGVALCATCAGIGGFRTSETG